MNMNLEYTSGEYRSYLETTGYVITHETDFYISVHKDGVRESFHKSELDKIITDLINQPLD